MLYRRLIEEHLGETKIVLSDDNRNMTYGDINDEVMCLRAFFQKNGVKREDRIMVADDDPIYTALVLLACIAEGAICVPVHGSLSREDREFIEKDCRPRLILSKKQREHPKEEGISARMTRGLLPESTLVYIIYTSGTEGTPKGVVASQKQILFCCSRINQRLEHTEKDKILSCLSLAFDYGMYQLFLALLSGAHLYLDGANILQRIPYLLCKWGITGFPTISTVANLLVKAGLLKGIGCSELRYITFTGENLPVSLIREIEALLPSVRIVPMYGLSECKRVSVMPPGREDKIQEGSCGIPLDGVKVWLENIDSETGAGELVVEGPNVMEGYWNITDEQTPVFSVNRLNGQRQVHTGDLCKIDAEGFLYFCGRRNNLIKICGYRVSGKEVEKRLREIAGVIEAAVFGTSDSLTGEKIVIYVYAEQKDIEKDIKEKMRSFPSYMQNYSLNVWNRPLPKNKNGKMDIKALQQRAEKTKC